MQMRTGERWFGECLAKNGTWDARGEAWPRTICLPPSLGWFNPPFSNQRTKDWGISSQIDFYPKSRKHMFTSWSHLIIYYIIGSFHLGSPWNLPQKCRTHFEAPLPNIECISSEKCLIVQSIREAEWCVCLFDKVDLSAHTLCVCYRSCGLNFSHDGSNASGRLPES